MITASRHRRRASSTPVRARACVRASRPAERQRLVQARFIRARRAARSARADVDQRQVQREARALSRRAGQADFAAEQLRQFARDRKAQARAAVLAAGRTVGLLERLEDDLLLVAADADAGVRHGERKHLLRTIQLVVVGRPAGEDFLDRERDLALVRELEGVRHIVFTTLW